MKKLILSTVVLASIILLAYASTENTINDLEGEEIAACGPHSESSNFDSPCELISLEEVKKRFKLDASIEISSEDEVYTYPTCTYSWKDGKVSKSMDIGGQKMNIELDSKLLIVMVKDVNESNYEASISVYSDGQYEGGIGDKATWSPNRAQLTFLFDRYLFHVHVKASNDNAVNRKNAIEIAGDIIAKLYTQVLSH
jgi:hypothetical protein